MSKKILIIEDDSFLQGIAVTKLKKEGYDVLAASTGTDGIKIADTEKPDLILLDLLLPGSDGFEVLANLKKDENTKSIPVIVFSNLAEDKDIVKAKELGASEFMTKSNFTLDELAVKIKEILG